jgi:hypothetical protein
MTQSKRRRPTPVSETTLDAVHPYVVLILTSSLPTATILAGIGQIVTAAICAAGGCVGAVMLVVTAKVIDAIKDKGHRSPRDESDKF